MAHIYLSFGDDQLAIGNFIADSIRGNKFRKYPDRVQEGILLHRAIDTFTDAHPTPRLSSKRLHKRYSHYSRVIVDIYYDHFLAREWERYSDIPLADFAAHFYDLLDENFDWLPTHVQRLYPYMVSDNWLVSYASTEGIGRVLQGMNRRTRNKSGMDRAIEDLEWHYEAFRDEFHSFFEELIIFSRQKIDTF
nr:acyl carrier protein phosphodiesterase [Robiginitalea sp. SC105]